MSIKLIEKNKEKISEIEKERKRLIKFLVSDCKLVEGSLRKSLIRCGRQGCHCEKEPIHPITRISRWVNGKLKNKIVRVADREWVKSLSDNYKKNKKALSDLVKLNEKEREIIKTVIKLKTLKYE
ncbi:MAG: hypothetical protein SCARUB_00790 [Candidatus Scalindua rubra]|uniref:DUF6788 domain-containing protein n=1 Tax=Candidatus Scalindua rubra TaxID=1872076 RepID=A0A1E3XEQ7_9BACT|nr:MAG: hypothetical protein SCARUB_00790 [Candidatus Scalindua rubra]